MTLPDNCIKGVPNQDFTKDGTVATHLFYFKDEARGDGWEEQSINWEDDERAIPFTLAQAKDDGQLQFREGAVIIPKSKIDQLNEQQTIRNLLWYERKTLSDNPYHGNILLRTGTSKPLMHQIAAGLALARIEWVRSV